MTDTLYRNPAARSWRTERGPGVIGFHRSMPGYRATRLVHVPELARELGIANVFVKEEASRLGLPAFKILGASYAIARALSARLGSDAALPMETLREELAATGGVELVAATDGNHGRAVARMARMLGLRARIFTPADISSAAKRAIESEGARRIELAQPYDDVVTAAAATAGENEQGMLLIQDTSWPGYEQIPQWIVDGYGTLLEEADQQLADAGSPTLDLVAVPVGVGSLAQAVVRHYRSGADAPRILSVEPTAAPNVLASLRAGHLVTVETTATIMAGLNCGTPSELGWPTLQAGLDAAVAVTDSEAARAVHDLEALGVDSGPCGAATLAGVRALARRGELAADATVLLVSTEARAANPLPEGTA